jgi:hypothetical protein
VDPNADKVHPPPTDHSLLGSDREAGKDRRKSREEGEECTKIGGRIFFTSTWMVSQSCGALSHHEVAATEGIAEPHELQLVLRPWWVHQQLVVL